MIHQNWQAKLHPQNTFSQVFFWLKRRYWVFTTISN